MATGSGFFDMNDPAHAIPLQVMRDGLAADHAEYQRAADAKKKAEAANGKGQDVSLKAMAAMEQSDTQAASFQAFCDGVADLTDTFDDAVEKGQEFVIAAAAQFLQELADVYADRAKTWAPDFKSAIAGFSDDDRISDEALFILGQQCDAKFRAILENCKQTFMRQSDKSARSIVEAVTGQETTLRETKKGVQFLLKRDRFRTPSEKTEDKRTLMGMAKDEHVVLYVNAERVDGDNWPTQVRNAFGVTPEDMMRKLEAAQKTLTEGANSRWTTNTDYPMMLNGEEVLVTVLIEKD